MTEQDEKELLELLKRNLPDTLAFRTEGGSQGKTEISGTLEDFLLFVSSIYREGEFDCYNGIAR